MSSEQSATVERIQPGFVLIEGAAQDTWYESHRTVIARTIHPQCTQIRIGAYQLDLIGSINWDDGSTGVVKEVPTINHYIELQGVAQASHQEIDRPRWAVDASGRVFCDRFLLGEMEAPAMIYRPEEQIDLGVKIFNRLIFINSLVPNSPES